MYVCEKTICYLLIYPKDINKKGKRKKNVEDINFLPFNLKYCYYYYHRFCKI